MTAPLATAQLIACRRLAMAQNVKLFEEANALNRWALDLLDRPDLDSDMFFQYLQLRGKAEAMFREALDHLMIVNEQFPPVPVRTVTRSVETLMAFAPPAAQGRADWAAAGEASA